MLMMQSGKRRKRRGRHWRDVAELRIGIGGQHVSPYPPPLFPSLLKGKRKNRRTQQVRCLETMRLPEGGPIWVVAAVGIDAHNNIRFIVFLFFLTFLPLPRIRITLQSIVVPCEAPARVTRPEILRFVLFF